MLVHVLIVAATFAGYAALGVMSARGERARRERDQHANMAHLPARRDPDAEAAAA